MAGVFIRRENVDAQERHRKCTYTEKRPRKEAARGQPSVRQGERLQRKPVLLAP